MTSPTRKPSHRLAAVAVPFVLLFSLISFVSGDDSGNATWWSFPAPPDDSSYLDKPFQPSMAVIVMVLICAFFFIGFMAIYIRHCTTESQGNTRLVSRLRLSRLSQRGLEPEVIDSFPTFTYSAVKGLKIGKGSLECAVCLCEFDDDDKIRLLPRCSHAFHPVCIDEWLASHVTCPVCRDNLREDPGEGVAGAVAIDILDEAGRPGNDQQEYAGRTAMLNQLAVVVTDEEANSNASASGRVPATKNLRFPPAYAQAKGGARSMRVFPRSHSTGHSLVPLESYERFTLRLPENARREIMTGRLNRVASCSVFGGRSRSGRRVGEGSSRSGRGIRRGWDNSTRSERRTFSIVSASIRRSFSGRSHRGAVVADSSTAENKPSMSKPISFPPLDCLGSRAQTSGQTAASTTAPAQLEP